MNSYVDSQVADTLSRAAAVRGALLLRGILIDVKVRTSFCRFLWIDRFGILAIDVQEWPGCNLRGTQRAMYWTARQKGVKRRKMGNPILEAEERRQVLLDSMLTCGRRIAPEYIQHIVVFAGSDISKVKLDEIERARCLDVAQLDSYVFTREDFPPNQGILEPQEIADFESLFRAIDRSTDEEAIRRHEAAHSSSRRAKHRGEAQVVLSDSAAGVAPVALHVSERYPSVGVNPVRTRRSPLPVLLVVLFALIAIWAFALGGRYVVASQVSALFNPGASSEGLGSQPQLESSGSGASVSTEHAIQVLRDNAPDVADSATNLNSPTVTVMEANTSFTWVYTSANSGPVPNAITLTFDSAGTLRGVSRQ